jgi:uncharacterized protein (TIGR03067 family)
MFRRVLAVSFSLSLVVLARAGDDPKRDAEQLQGAWEATAYEAAGTPATADEVKAFRVRVEGDRLTLTTAAGETTAAFKLDPSAWPKAIDLVIAGATRRGRPSSGSTRSRGTDSSGASGRCRTWPAGRRDSGPRRGREPLRDAEAGQEMNPTGAPAGLGMIRVRLNATSLQRTSFTIESAVRLRTWSPNLRLMAETVDSTLLRLW